MKIIVLLGGDNCGKTTTMKLVYDKLDPKTIFEEKHRPEKLTNDAFNDDFECLIGYNGKKIAIFSHGDKSRIVVDAIKRYDAINVDILIISCNTGIINPMERIKKYQHYTIVKKNIANNRDNNSACSNIIAAI